MSQSIPFAVSADGTQIHAVDTGRGHPVVVFHGGMQSAARWDDVAARLAGHWRLIAVERRLYGRSGPPQSAHAIGREVEDATAVIAALGEPAILLGHSSGGIVALETALTLKDALAGLIVYEPPVQIIGPFGGDAQLRADAAMAAGDVDEALRIFFTDMVQLPEHMVTYMRTSPNFAGGWGEFRRLAAAQMADNRAIRELPLGVERFAAIALPTLLLKGDQSPRHLQETIDTLGRTIPGSLVRPSWATGTAPI